MGGTDSEASGTVLRGEGFRLLFDEQPVRRRLRGPALAERIEQRFEAMIDAGFVAEVEALMARGDLNPDLPAMRAVGYRQLWGYLSGDYDWAEARRRAVAATRQLAKRQMTWIRSEQNFGILPWSNEQQLGAVLEWARSAQSQ